MRENTAASRPGRGRSSSVENAVNLPFDEGMAKERAIFSELVVTNQSKAQRYVFFAERQAAKVADIPADTPTRKIAKVGVIGAGTMGGGISMNFLSAGIPVTIVETSKEALDRGVSIMRRNYENTAKKGRMTLGRGRGADGQAEPDARLQCAGRRRPRDRSGVRGHGPQEDAFSNGSTRSPSPARSSPPTPPTSTSTPSAR